WVDADQIKETSSRAFEDCFRFDEIILDLRERFRIAKWQYRKGEAGRHHLDRPLRSNVADLQPKRSGYFFSRQDRSKLRIALTHFPENTPIYATAACVLRVGTESDGNFPDVQIEYNLIGTLNGRTI